MRKNKFILYLVLFIISLITFILQIFVFEAPNGIGGIILCLLCIYIIIGTLIKMCKNSKSFRNVFKNIIDILFWLP